MKSLSNENGMVLLLVLFITALLAALLSELAFSTLVDLRLAETYRDSSSAYYLAKGGIQVGSMVLADDDNDYDGDNELWAQGISNYPVGDIGLVSISITALDGKININRLISTSGNIDVVVKDRCLRLFNILEIDTAEEHIDALIDWMDSDNDPQPLGVESEYYASQTPSSFCKNAPLDTLDELQLVAGFTQEEVDKLRPHLSVYGGDKIHLNSASAEVLYALAEEMEISSAEEIVAWRNDNPFQAVEELKLLPNWESFYWAVNSFLDVKAQYYRIDTAASISDGRCRTTATINKTDNALLYMQIY
ncbi:MAG: type II secretion system minor pseudopilin GspK [Desulfuromonas sp.]|nr:type II secretion system minor pseudopilin GspK [Desulfuromonas sp.]